MAPSCAYRCAPTGMNTREHRLRVGHQPRKRVPPVPRRWALVVRPQLRHPFTMTLTIEVRIVRIQASHLLSPLGLDWESPESSPGKEEGRCAVTLNSHGYRAPCISKGLCFRVSADQLSLQVGIDSGYTALPSSTCLLLSSYVLQSRLRNDESDPSGSPSLDFALTLSASRSASRRGLREG